MTILITGATDGIGLALARHYARLGARLILVGRRETAPDVGGEALYCRADLAADTAAADVERCLAAHGVEALDVVIHNAGVGYYGRFADQSWDSIENIYRVNLETPILLTQALLPRLRRARGQLVFISSMVTALPGPDYAVYTATKRALDGFARSLRPELRGEVTVQVIHPGATFTGMHVKMGIAREVMDWTQFTPVDETAIRIASRIKQQKPAATLFLSNRIVRALGHLGLFDRILQRAAPAEMAAGPAGEPPVCVITGAAAGIGQALALRFGRAGWRIIGVDVDAAAADAAAARWAEAGVDGRFLLADLSQPADIARVAVELAAQGPVDCVVHNAGISAVGRFGRVPAARQRAVLRLNLLAPLLLTSALLQRAVLRPGGSWVFVSSLSYFVGYPGAAVYAASKDGLAAFARGFRVANEANQHILTLYPGATRTGHARRFSPENGREARRMPPEQVADAVYRAVGRRRPTLVPGAGNALFALLGRLAPGIMTRAMERVILDKVGERVLL
ncbi:MAG: SDR family NAD(P)-dependent oxidoreductase [Anaerolineales bacterium]|nr:SDR family NAD(P)-dependent oxidoreductase [Anaerolineales bacterium]